MKKLLISAAASLALSATAAQAEDAKGYWSGRIANALAVSVQFEQAADGHWEATLSVPSQNLVTKVDKVEVTPDRISFALPKFKASYAATWNASEAAWTGTWTQGQATPLNLKRSSREALTPKRPQEEAIARGAPAYQASEVGFANEAAGVTLAGTLAVPPGKGPFPAVVLVHGSGPIDRDSEVFGHKLFLVLADHLARQGIAVLRYDKRGVGKSTGKLKEATTLDLAADAEAALRYLRTRPEIDARRTGVIGHSEGGLIAPLLASRDPSLAFVVMLAGPGIRGDKLLVEQLALSAKLRGVPEAAIARDRVLHQALFEAMVAEKTVAGARTQASRILDEAERKGEIPAGTSKAMVERFGNAWFHSLLGYEPGPVLRAVRQPVLALNGERDAQVLAGMDLPAVRTALAGNPQALVKEMPGLNHLFQNAKTGAVAEYAEIEETVAPVALETIGNWIAATVKK